MTVSFFKRLGLYIIDLYIGDHTIRESPPRKMIPSPKLSCLEIFMSEVLPAQLAGHRDELMAKPHGFANVQKNEAVRRSF